GIINFAHGSIFTLGAYFTYTLMGQAYGFNGLLKNQSLAAAGISLPFAVALLLGSLLAGLVGVAVERVAFRPLRRRGADRLLYLVSSLGVAIVLVNLIQYLVGAEAYSYRSNLFCLPEFVASPAKCLPATFNFGSEARRIPVRSVQIVIFAVSAVILVALTLLINRSKLGKALQAVAEDTTTASLLGINPDRLIVLTFFLSGFLGGLAGALVATGVGISGPYFGITFGLRGLAVIVLGGLGSVPGAVLGGLVIGLAEAFVPAEAVGYKDAIAFALLLGMLLIRPQGLLGRAQLQKV
ncbi:MAG TPA: branched-chain amino acid ABC transporter permease, partial [Herpetosiphonaceae bacterium]